MIEAWGSCSRCHRRAVLVAHGSLCAPCLGSLSAIDNPPARRPPMKHADGELGDREPRDRKTAVVPQAVAETTAIRDAREAGAKAAAKKGKGK